MITVGSSAEIVTVDPESIAAIKQSSWNSQSKGVRVHGIVLYMKTGVTVTVESADEGQAAFETGKAQKDCQEALGAAAEKGTGALVRHLLAAVSRIEDRQVEIKKKLDRMMKEVKPAKGKAKQEAKSDLPGE